ncbi:MAG: extracellular solute-binding protein [Haloplanus sp.]
MPQDEERRQFMKTAGVAATGALGALAGCSGGGGSGDSGGGGGGGSPSSESVTVSFWSGLAAENKALTEHFRSSMETFKQQKNGKVSVDLTPVSYGDMKSKLSSAVNAGNAPDIASSGVAGINFWENGNAPDHGPWIKETGISEDWMEWQKQAVKYRDQGYWAGGTVGANTTLLTVRPHFFKDAGVNDPSEFETWTGFTRAIQSVAEANPNVYAYEESGRWNDLEPYWGQAQTAYTNGKDPWFNSPAWENPEQKLRVGQEPKTDEMMRACVDRARQYSSPSCPTRTDEQMPALLLGDRAASNTTGFGNPQRWRSQDPDVTFGWDGDVYQAPIPKVDPNYGNEFGYEGLAGVSGQHGGSSSGLESQNQVFKSDVQEQAFDLQYYLMTNPDHVAPIIGELYGNVAGYIPANDIVKQRYDLVQIQQAMIDAMTNTPSQYRSTGAGWDLSNTSAVRWDAMNKTISSAIAGQVEVETLPSTVRQKIVDAL